MAGSTLTVTCMLGAGSSDFGELGATSTRGGCGLLILCLVVLQLLSKIAKMTVGAKTNTFFMSGVGDIFTACGRYFLLTPFYLICSRWHNR